MREADRLVHAYFAAVTAGDLPDDLLTEDMTAWLTTQGSIDKRAYQAAVRWLGSVMREPLRFTIDAITAEGDRAVAEARSEGVLINGEPYAQTYVFVLRIRDGRIASIAEHYNAFIAQEKLVPLMARQQG
ncbi:MAG TPA: nuclear transport factor 2 family protein [Novosphingobium sp.]